MTLLRGAWLLLPLTLSACSDGSAGRRSEVAMMLYGQPDPDVISAGGLHGWSRTVTPVELTELAPCRFRVAAAGRFEEIDFDQVDAIRVSLVPDPASGLAAVIAGRNGIKHTVDTVVLVQIIGTETAVCSAEGCRDRQSFAIRGTGQLDRVRRAAAAMKAHSCERKGESHAG